MPNHTIEPATDLAPEITELKDYAFSDSFFSYTGTGDDVMTGLDVENYSYLKVTHFGFGHFAIKAHHDDTYELLINTTDPYDGGLHASVSKYGIYSRSKRRRGVDC